MRHDLETGADVAVTGSVLHHHAIDGACHDPARHGNGLPCIDRGHAAFHDLQGLQHIALAATARINEAGINISRHATRPDDNVAVGRRTARRIDPA